MCNDITDTSVLLMAKARQELFKITLWKINMNEKPAARWLSWLKRLTSNEEIPSSNLGRAFLFSRTINSFGLSAANAMRTSNLFVFIRCNAVI